MVGSLGITIFCGESQPMHAQDPDLVSEPARAGRVEIGVRCRRRQTRHSNRPLKCGGRRWSRIPRMTRGHLGMLLDEVIPF